MTRLFAKWWAKRSYVFQLELEAGKGDINAAIATRNAEEAQKAAEKLNESADASDAQAEAIDKNIEVESAKLKKGYWECENGHDEPMSTAFAGIELEIARTCSSCHKPMKIIRLDLMTGQEKYELEKQKKEAQGMAEKHRAEATEKRALAKQHRDSVAEKESTARSLSSMADNARTFADKIRAI